MGIFFTRAFIKQFNKYDEALQEAALEKIKEFKDTGNHKRLRVHKLHGKFSNCYSFSVDYRTRIVFEYLSKKKGVAFLSIGDHEIYD